MMNSLFQQITERAEQSRLAAESEWRGVVRSLVAGTATEKDVVAALKTTGRTLEDLQRDLAFRQRIDALYATFATWPDIERASREAEREFAAFHRRRQENELATHAECQRITTRQQSAQNDVQRVAGVRRELSELLGEPVNFPDVPDASAAWPELAEVVV